MVIGSDVAESKIQLMFSRLDLSPSLGSALFFRLYSQMSHDGLRRFKLTSSLLLTPPVRRKLLPSY